MEEKQNKETENITDENLQETMPQRESLPTDYRPLDNPKPKVQYNEVQPKKAQPEKVQDLTEPVVGVGDWVVTRIIMAIPFVGTIVSFIWAFGKFNKNKKNYAISVLITTAIKYGLFIIFIALCVILAVYFPAEKGNNTTPDNAAVEIEDVFENIDKNSVFGVAWKTAETEEGKCIFMGTAFGVQTEWSKNPILLSAFHLFGYEDDETFTGKDIKDYVSGGRLFDILDINLDYFYDEDREVMDAYGTPLNAQVKEPIIIEDAKKFDNDVAAFSLTDTSEISPMKLADKDPKKGDVVYALGIPYNERGKKSEYVFRGTVWDIDDAHIWIDMDEEIDYSGLSGCPIVNENGEVAGLFYGGKEGACAGMSVSVIRKDLEKAMGKHKTK